MMTKSNALFIYDLEEPQSTSAQKKLMVLILMKFTQPDIMHLSFTIRKLY